MYSKFAAFLRAPVRVGFVVLLTLFMLPFGTSSTVQAAEYSIGYSCVFIHDQGGGLPALGDTITIRCNHSLGWGTNITIADGTSLSNGASTPFLYNGGSFRANTSPTPTDYLNSYGTNNHVIDRSCGVGCFESTLTINDLPQTSATIRWCSFDSATFCNSSDVPVSAAVTQAYITSTNIRSLTLSVDPAAIPLDTFTGADNWQPPVTDRCENVKVAVQYQGDALTVADYDDTFYPANGQPGRDDFVFLATFEDHNLVEDPDGMNLEYRWPGVANWSPAFFETLDTVAINGGEDSAITFRVGTSIGRYLSQIQWKCTDDQGGDRYLPFWDPGPSVNEPAWQTFTAFANPCSAIVITTPTGSIAPGTVARMQYSLGSSAGLDLEVFAYGVANFSPSTTPRIPVYSQTALGSPTGGPPPLLNGVAPGFGVLTFTLPSTVDAPISYDDLVFSCTDLVVSDVIVPGSADLGLTGTLDPTPSPTCWQQGGMSLTSPASWIAGMAKMLSCIARELLVPDGAALLEEVQTMNATVAERPPFIAVAAIVGFAGDLSDSFSATSGSGCFTGPSIPGVSASADMCAGADINLEPGQRSTMALLLTAPMVLGLAGHMFGLLRGQSEFITEDSGQMAWRM